MNTENGSFQSCSEMTMQVLHTRGSRLSVEILQLQSMDLKIRVPSLSCGIICVILRLAVFTQYQNVTDARTDRQTDGQITRRRYVLRLA